MTTPPIKVIFMPGCFDEFEGSQEELDELVAHITEMANSNELLEKSELVDQDELEPEELERISKAITGISPRKLQ